MATKNKSIKSFWNNIAGFMTAALKNDSYLVNKEEGKFIRQLRWKKY